MGLRVCAAGHQLINSTDQSGVFVHDAQRCERCDSSQYVLDPATTKCQDCAIGGVCDSTRMLPRDPGSVWAQEEGRLRIVACDVGFVLVRDPSNPVIANPPRPRDKGAVRDVDCTCSSPGSSSINASPARTAPTPCKEQCTGLSGSVPARLQRRWAMPQGCAAPVPSGRDAWVLEWRRKLGTGSSGWEQSG
eukprot:1778876-Rhodomonas_salina.1